VKKLFCFILLAAAGAAHARDLFWQPFDTLGAGDRSYAEQTLYDEFGDKPDLWPDWIDPAALYAPTADGDRMLIVRRPVHEPCGQYRFVVFGTVTPALTREKWGEFCAGSVEVVKVEGRSLPDLMVLEGRQQDENGLWQRQDLRLRWDKGQWWRVLKAAD
jgi:hypothetical protein